MAKFFGVVGFSEGQVEIEPGIWVERIVEKEFYGDLIRPARQLEVGDKVNSDLRVNNSISILADGYASDHFFAIRYVQWAGVLWDVPDVQVQSPRLVLRLGGVYDGERGIPQPPEGAAGV